jgi:hypothetical protein
MSKQLYTAIVFFIPGTNAAPAMKYRKISDKNKFVQFAQNKYPNIQSINFYERDSRLFIEQVRIKAIQ